MTVDDVDRLVRWMVEHGFRVLSIKLVDGEPVLTVAPMEVKR